MVITRYNKSLPHTRETCWAYRLAWRLAQLCIFTAHVGKTTQQQHNWQNHLHFPPFCSKSHEETMVCHWLIDSNSSALSSQHPQTLRFFPREVKNIKHDRYFPQGSERSNPHENFDPHTRETCWASFHARWMVCVLFHCWIENNVHDCGIAIYLLVKEDRYIPVQLHFLSSVCSLVHVLLQVSDRRCIYHLSEIPVDFRHHYWFHCVIHNSPRHHWQRHNQHNWKICKFFARSKTRHNPMLSSLLSWWMLRAGIEHLEKDDIVRVAKKLRGYAGTTRKEGLPYVRLNQQRFYRYIICANVIQVHKEIKGSTNCIDHYCLAYLVR